MSTQHTAISPGYRPAPTFADPKSPVGRAVMALAGVVTAIATHYRISRDIGQLQALSDETLRDIGVKRSEILSLVHERAHGGAYRRHVQD